MINFDINLENYKFVLTAHKHCYGMKAQTDMLNTSIVSVFLFS